MCSCSQCVSGGKTYTEEYKQACLQRYSDRSRALEIMAMKSLTGRRSALASVRETDPARAARLEEIIKAEWGKRSGEVVVG